MALTAGSLRFYGVVEQPSPGVDGSGGRTMVWQRVGDWILDIEPAESGETFDDSRRVVSRVTHKGQGRWMPGVGPKGRFVVGEGSTRRIFAIIAAYDIDGRQREMAVHLSEEIGGAASSG